MVERNKKGKNEKKKGRTEKNKNKGGDYGLVRWH